MTHPDIFLSYKREDQAVARGFAEAFELEGLTVWWDATLRSLGQHEEARDAMRRLRLAAPTVTPEGMEALNRSSLIPPDVAAEMNVVLRKVWEDTPVTA